MEDSELLIYTLLAIYIYNRSVQYVTIEKNYLQDIPEDFISEMKEAFKLFDKVKFTN